MTNSTSMSVSAGISRWGSSTLFHLVLDLPSHLYTYDLCNMTRCQEPMKISSTNNIAWSGTAMGFHMADKVYCCGSLKNVTVQGFNTMPCCCALWECSACPLSHLDLFRKWLGTSQPDVTIWLNITESLQDTDQKQWSLMALQGRGRGRGKKDGNGGVPT